MPATTPSTTGAAAAAAARHRSSAIPLSPNARVAARRRSFFSRSKTPTTARMEQMTMSGM
eukprot:scaffold46837_cov30-Tisochrysis_lutea.AAC.5